MIKTARQLILLLAAVFLFATASSFAQSPALWRDVDETAMVAARTRTQTTTQASPRRNLVPKVYRTVGLNRSGLEHSLAAAPREFANATNVAGVVVELPLPDGGTGRFTVQESPIMDPELAAKYPEIKTYTVQGIDDPAANGRIDLTPQGFHGLVSSPGGQFLIDPYWRDSDATYVVYQRSDYATDKALTCLLEPNEMKEAKPAESPRTPGISRPTGASLRKYRLALACTGEYAAAVCSPNAPTVPKTLAAMVTTINRVNSVYERDFAIRVVLIANTDLLIYLDGATDPYSNNDGVAMLGQNQTNIDSVIGSANYDIGHVLSTGGGGVAGLGAVCTSNKAQGESGSNPPLADIYDVGIVAHEMGHQFNANHSYNSAVFCAPTRNGPTAYEVGSGSTIMSYAGICNDGATNTNIQFARDDYFYSSSYTEIDNYSSSGAGSGCPVSIATGNNPPVIAALSNYTIPANNPSP